VTTRAQTDTPAIEPGRMVAVGAASDRSARLWLRSDTPGPFTVEIRPRGGEPRTATVADLREPGADGTMSFAVPDDAPALGPLAPGAEHEFRITASATGDLVGQGRFETAPAPGSRGAFSFAFMSCHQPFKHGGAVHPDSARMLTALGPALEARDVKYALLVGDQIYADAPAGRRLLHTDARRPLLGMPEDEIRARYQARYRRFWASEEMRRLQASRATWCIWDDHEIVDDWGSRLAHREPAWRRVFDGARRAFVDYQASRSLAPGREALASFHQSFVWGPAATFAMDLYSERSFDGREARIYGDHQLAALEAFLREHRALPVAFVVLTIPPVYLPDWVVTLGELVPRYRILFASRWNARRNRAALDGLFDVLRAHARDASDQKLVLLSGDVHEGAALALRWPGGGRAYEFVSSPVTNARRNWKELLARRLSFSMRRVRHGAAKVAVERLACSGPGQQNPFGGLNVGVVTVGDEGATVRLELLTCGEGSSETARVAYDSGPR
jgi:alkaline phosphatase D